MNKTTNDISDLEKVYHEDQNNMKTLNLFRIASGNVILI